MVARALLTLLSGAALTAGAPWSASRRDTGTTSNSATSSCNTYMVKGPWGPAYFNNHLYHDFRNLSNIPAAPPKVTQHGDQEDDDYIAQLHKCMPGWGDEWKVSVSDRYGRGYSYPLENSQKNTYLVQSTDNSADYGTYMRMRTYRLDAFQSGAEILTQRDMTSASFRFLARASGDTGAVIGFFTYADDDNESDMEIRTMDTPDMYHYNTQPSDAYGASFDLSSMPSWNDWHVHRLDWFNNGLAWYIDNTLVAKSSVNYPKKASTCRLNIWSSGGAFSGNMSVGGEAHLDIQWLEIVYNATDSSSSKVKRTGAGQPNQPQQYCPPGYGPGSNGYGQNGYPYCGSGSGGSGNDDDDVTTTSSTKKTTSTSTSSTPKTTSTSSSSVKTTSSSTTSSTVKTTSTSSTSSSIKTTSTSSTLSTATKTTSTSTKSSTTSSATSTYTAAPGVCAIDDIDGVPNAGRSSN